MNSSSLAKENNFELFSSLLRSEDKRLSIRFLRTEQSISLMVFQQLLVLHSGSRKRIIPVQGTTTHITSVHTETEKRDVNKFGQCPRS